MYQLKVILRTWERSGLGHKRSHSLSLCVLWETTHPLCVSLDTSINKITMGLETSLTFPGTKEGRS